MQQAMALSEDRRRELGNGGRLLLMQHLSDDGAPSQAVPVPTKPVTDGPPTEEEKSALVLSCMPSNHCYVNEVLHSSSVEGPLNSRASCAQHFGLVESTPRAAKEAFKSQFARFCAFQRCYRVSLDYSYEEEYQGSVTWGDRETAVWLAAFDRAARVWALGPRVGQYVLPRPPPASHGLGGEEARRAEVRRRAAAAAPPAPPPPPPPPPPTEAAPRDLYKVHKRLGFPALPKDAQLDVLVNGNLTHIESITPGFGRGRAVLPSRLIEKYITVSPAEVVQYLRSHGYVRALLAQHSQAPDRDGTHVVKRGSGFVRYDSDRGCQLGDREFATEKDLLDALAEEMLRAVGKAK